MEYSFGTWVKRRRKALDLTQQELAQRVGCSPSLIFKVESDGRRPSRQMAELLAKYLEIPADQHELFRQVARQEKGLDRLKPVEPVPETIPTPASHPSQNNLPIPLTPLIGREHELRAITQKIQDPACRLFTLIGPGGVGKTRLALETAHRLQTSFEAGACFISLIGTGTSDFIIPAIADALGLVSAGAFDLKTQLFHFLKEKQILIVLDNLEHLLNGIELLDELLQYAPRVKILTTSREQLNLRAEWIFEVQGLPVPANIELDKLGSNSAVALFTQRARQVHANFAPASADLPAIMHICQLVDGLPLGLELAATWARLISVQEIADEIERSMDFLTTAARDVPARHRSIRAVFDHSWNLLSNEEQRVMECLSVFHGGFTRDAAEQVAKAALPLLSALVEKSMVQRSGSMRYDLHELIRQHAATFLSQNVSNQAEAFARFSSYYMTLLKRRNTALRSSLQKGALTELVQDIDNLRAAWEAAVEHDEFDLIGEAAFPLWYLYNLRDALHEGELAFTRAASALRTRLDQTGADLPECRQLQAVLGELLSHQAQFTFRQGRNLEAAALYQSSLSLLRPLNESSALAQALTYCGVVSWITGEFDRARLYLNEGLSVSSAIDDEWLMVQCRTFMGMVAHARGDYPDAYNDLNDSIIHARALGDTRLISFVAGHLGRTAQALGRTDELMDLLRESLQLATETGDRLGLGVTFEQMAVVIQNSGDEQEAQRLLKESIFHFREIGDTWFLAHALNLAGYFAIARGENTLALENFKEAGSLAFDNQAIPNILDALAGVALLDAQADRCEQALETALFILGEPASTWDARQRIEKLCSELESQLTPQQIETARSRSQSLSLEARAQELASR